MSPRAIAFLMSLALLLGVQSVASSHRLPANYVYTTRPDLQGHWKVIGSLYNGKARYPHTENTYWRITKDQIIILIDGRNRGAWNYRFVDQTPGGIDLNNYPSLFELRDGELKVCICQFPDKGARATGFHTRPDSVHVMYHLRLELKSGLTIRGNPLTPTLSPYPMGRGSVVRGENTSAQRNRPTSTLPPIRWRKGLWCEGRGRGRKSLVRLIHF